MRSSPVEWNWLGHGTWSFESNRAARARHQEAARDPIRRLQHDGPADRAASLVSSRVGAKLLQHGRARAGRHHALWTDDNRATPSAVLGAGRAYPFSWIKLETRWTTSGLT